MTIHTRVQLSSPSAELYTIVGL